MRRLELIGLLVVVTLTLVATPATDAFGHSFHFEGKTSQLTGEGESLLGTKGSSLQVTCSKANFTAAVTGEEVVELTASPSYSLCTTSGLGETTWDMEGCDFVVHGVTTMHLNTKGKEESDAPVDILCPGEKKIKITAPKCTISLAGQTGLHGLTFQNKGQKQERYVKYRWTLDGASYTTEGVNCSSLSLGKSGTDLFYTAISTAKSYENSGGKEGKRTGTWVGEAPASATQEFHSESGTTVITGQQTTESVFSFKSSVASLACKSAAFGGTAGKATSDEITVHPTFKECALLGSSASFDFEGCDLVVYSTTTTRLDTSGATVTDSPFELECSPGKSPKVTLPGCTLAWAEQAPLHGTSIANEGSGSTRDMSVSFRVDQLHYTAEGAFCALFELAKEGSDGFLTGQMTLRGYQDNAGSPSPHQDEFSEGSQVGIWVE